MIEIHWTELKTNENKYLHGPCWPCPAFLVCYPWFDRYCCGCPLFHRTKNVWVSLWLKLVKYHSSWYVKVNTIYSVQSCPKKISSKILQDSERSDTKFGMTIKMLIAKRLRLTNGKYGTMFSTGIELNVVTTKYQTNFLRS